MRHKLSLFFIFTLATRAVAQQPPATFTAEQDHQNMMEQLGIQILRPGPSADAAAVNHANYDESLANPYPVLPDVLTLKNGKPVTTAEQWWTLRRPEIVEDMEREVYGRLPRDLPTVTWSVQSSERELVGRTAVIAKQLVGHVDNASYPAIAVDIAMTVVLPADAKGPAPGSHAASSVSSTRDAFASRTIGACCGPGLGAPREDWTISRPTRPWTRGTWGSKASPATAKPRS